MRLLLEQPTDICRKFHLEKKIAFLRVIRQAILNAEQRLGYASVRPFSSLRPKGGAGNKDTLFSIMSLNFQTMNLCP